MATYNTFVVMDCKKRAPVLVTSSARKARGVLTNGFRIEVWSDNEIKEKIYHKSQKFLHPYIEAEKEYIRQKQERATQRRVNRCDKA